MRGDVPYGSANLESLDAPAEFLLHALKVFALLNPARVFNSVKDRRGLIYQRLELCAQWGDLRLHQFRGAVREEKGRSLGDPRRGRVLVERDFAALQSAQQFPIRLDKSIAESPRQKGS